MRDNFTGKTKVTLAQRVGYDCSNPNCDKVTIGPNSDNQKSTNMGVAAHIKAASERGCRYDKNQTSEERKNIENGIWLCQNCAKLIDSDESLFSVELLNKWKNISENIQLQKIMPNHETDESRLIQKINNGEYLKLPLDKAFDIIQKTQNINEEFSVFINNIESELKIKQFEELTFDQIKENVLNNLDIDLKMDSTPISVKDVERSFNQVKIYEQRYSIKLKGHLGKIFIYRIPTQEEFLFVKNKLQDIILYFKARLIGNYSAKFEEIEANILIRGKEHFFDIQFAKGVNSKAWIGLDFRK